MSADAADRIGMPFERRVKQNVTGGGREAATIARLDITALQHQRSVRRFVMMPGNCLSTRSTLNFGPGFD